MKPKRLAWALCPSAAAALTLFGCTSHRTFYVGEHTDFSQCGGSDLNTITADFVDFLRNHESWKGVWFMEGNAWPQDHMDEALSSEGIDFDWGDQRNLTAYAGHGFTDPRAGLAYGTSHDGRCTVDIDRHVVLGENDTFGGNGEASFYFVMTSCTMNVPHLEDVWLSRAAVHGLAQAFGFHDSPAINDDEPGDFLENVHDSSSRSNRTEWLNKMDNCGPWYWFCSNSPMILTVGESKSHAEDIHFEANLFYKYQNPTVDPAAWYWYSYIDNGDGPCG